LEFSRGNIKDYFGGGGAFEPTGEKLTDFCRLLGQYAIDASKINGSRKYRQSSRK
jgi:hypothetical protein